MKRCELQPIFTELRLFKDSASALRGSPQPSQCLSSTTKMKTNTETAMLSNFDTLDTCEIKKSLFTILTLF